jgi:hypothetical protein
MSPVTKEKLRALLSAVEMQLLDASLAPNLIRLEESLLRRYIGQARTLEEKYRQLACYNQLVAAAGPEVDNNLLRAEVFGHCMSRFRHQLDTLENKESSLEEERAASSSIFNDEELERTLSANTSQKSEDDKSLVAQSPYPKGSLGTKTSSSHGKSVGSYMNR